MQLFLIDKPLKAENIILTDSGVVHQVSRVLRMKAGDGVSLQWQDNGKVTRGLYSVVQLSKKSLELEMTGEPEIREISLPGDCITLAVALPNKRSKAELIVQKLAEIGVGEIIRFVAQRSKYDTIPDKKLERMNDIVKEATEQSRGRKGMKITIGGALGEICDTYNKKSYIVCDILDDKEPNGIIETLTEVNSQYIIFIGPEGGRGPQDYQYLLRYGYHTLSLGSSVLRMETAAIIAGWKGVNETKGDI